MATASTPRQKYLKRAELRALVLTAGKDLLLEDGLGVGIDRLSLSRVFERIEDTTGRRVTAASVYERLWADQTEFQWDVLAMVIEEASPVHGRTRDRLRAIVEASDRTTADGRRRGLEAVCSAAVDLHLRDLLGDPHSRLILAVMGAVASAYGGVAAAPAHVERVREAVRGYIDSQTRFYTTLYLDLGYHLGYRLRDPLELEQFVLAVHALGEGLALRAAFVDSYGVEVFPGGDGGTGVTLAAVAVEALALRMLEPDPDWTPQRLVDGPPLT